MKIENLGRLVATRAVADLRESNQEFNEFVNTCLNRYLNNDWGDLHEDDKNMNDHAVDSGDDRILASYQFTDNGWDRKEDKLWIITEWDRSVTTILFSSEY